MMAKAFAAFRDRSDMVVFASGVSNSLETDPAAFKRERELLQEVRKRHPGALLVYFGTCSVDDPERRDTPYVQHKMGMEALLGASQGAWLVLRIPLAIGRNAGSQTLAQFLHERIAHGEPFEIWEGAARYPIDVDDALRIGGRLINDPAMWRRCINVALRQFPVLDFVRVLEEIVGRKANYLLVRKGQRYELDCPEILQIAGELGLDLTEGYLAKVLHKYFDG